MAIDFGMKKTETTGVLNLKKNDVLDLTKSGSSLKHLILGAGKSFSAKREMLNILLNTDDEVYVIDPEGVDYVPLANALGGSEIKLR